MIDFILFLFFSFIFNLRLEISAMLHMTVTSHKITYYTEDYKSFQNNNIRLYILRSRKVDLVFFLLIFIFFSIYFFLFLFLEFRVRVKTHKHKKKGMKG